MNGTEPLLPFKIQINKLLREKNTSHTGNHVGCEITRHKISISNHLRELIFSNIT